MALTLLRTVLFMPSFAVASPLASLPAAPMALPVVPPFAASTTAPIPPMQQVSEDHREDTGTNAFARHPAPDGIPLWSYQAAYESSPSSDRPYHLYIRPKRP